MKGLGRSSQTLRCPDKSCRFGIIDCHGPKLHGAPFCKADIDCEPLSALVCSLTVSVGCDAWQVNQ